MKSKIKGLLIFSLFYILAYTAGFFSMRLFQSTLLKLSIFDLTATIVIYFGSLIIDNASIYDAYWSLTPFVMIIYLFIINISTLNIYHYIFIILFSTWSNRLTVNWVITYKDYKWMDWRYKMYKDKFPKLYPIINLFGIELMPTILVFMAFVPIIFILRENINALSLIGDFIILLGIFLETKSDHDIHNHLSSDNRMNVCDDGLFKYSRHPNYLGEISNWIGVALVYHLSIDGPLIYGLGFIFIILLFEFISIPMMEKRQMERRSDYKDYIKRTSRLLILPRR